MGILHRTAGRVDGSPVGRPTWRPDYTDRLTLGLALGVTSLFGTNQTHRDACCLAAFGCKADTEPFSTRENAYTTAYTKWDALVKNVSDFKPLQRDQRELLPSAPRAEFIWEMPRQVGRQSVTSSTCEKNHRTVTWTRCTALLPKPPQSKRGSTGWVSPSASVARHISSCSPGLACQSRCQPRQA
jgi:hypothetical protein